MQALLDELLEEESVRHAADLSNNPTNTMRQVRFVILRNKADLLAEQDATAELALQLYGEAVSIDSDDPALWNCMGSLVRSHTHVQ